MPHQNLISTLLSFVFTLSSAWIVGMLIWQFYPSSHSVSQWTPAQVDRSSSSLSSSSLQTDVSSINQAQLFGQYSQQGVVAPVVQDAPKSRLNLVLVGAVVSNQAEKSLAVIAHRGKQGTYGLGEQIDGTRATVKAILIDRIIISNAGRNETVMLEGLEYRKLQLQTTPSAASSNVIGNNPVNNEEKLATIRQTITQDPQQIFQYVRLSQVKRDGKVLGYRVSPGRDPELFNAVGLQNGDVAIQLNGADLTDPAAMGKIYKTITELTELNLTVERDGQQHDIFIQF
ncbi:type II secretion system protein GspC [Vibrio sp. ZSDZ34]|jgi:general secretion pathway protein C|uniref:Type II secretion system protein GspC n=1 Tax=Vibrio gelatinilyticus TaxID=2893468 RepID=A0A9X1WEJ8_9VIBR|nr:type II secretion system protein GspC [Vibrio gelatinilyticus]MCJ2378886.1 type II secretion system protein GspC [Vibrio gelatinilyticus]